jgi:hypothetical protein
MHDLILFRKEIASSSKGNWTALDIINSIILTINKDHLQIRKSLEFRIIITVESLLFFDAVITSVFLKRGF